MNLYRVGRKWEPISFLPLTLSDLNCYSSVSWSYWSNYGTTESHPFSCQYCLQVITPRQACLFMRVYSTTIMSAFVAFSVLIYTVDTQLCWSVLSTLCCTRKEIRRACTIRWLMITRLALNSLGYKARVVRSHHHRSFYLRQHGQ